MRAARRGAARGRAVHRRRRDHTHTWARTNWGGALFCLLADIEICERTGGRRGLVDALRAIVAAGGNSQADWTIERAFREGDKAGGAPVLTELYERMKDGRDGPGRDLAQPRRRAAARQDRARRRRTEGGDPPSDHRALAATPAVERGPRAAVA